MGSLVEQINHKNMMENLVEQAEQAKAKIKEILVELSKQSDCDVILSNGNATRNNRFDFTNTGGTITLKGKGFSLKV